MVDTRAGQQMTALYQRTALAINAATLRDLLAMWPTFRLDDIDGSWRALLPGLMALIESRHRLAAQRAASYYEAVRLAEGVSGSATPRLAPFDPVKARANLELVGPIWTKRSIANNAANVLETALVRISGEVSRLTMNGGRDTIVQSLAVDPRARGYSRETTSSEPCDFCQMLAGRGRVYRADTVAFKAHTNCHCRPEPRWFQQSN